MNNRKTIIVAAVVAFALVELAAIVVGIWPILFLYERVDNARCPLRLGILPLPSKSESRKVWEVLLRDYAARYKDVKLAPYYANNYEELLNGFLHGSLDLAYVNPEIYNELRQKMAVLPLVACQLFENDGENRAVLATVKDFHLLRQTKAVRMTFVDRHSLSGYLMPLNYIRDKTGVPPERWFSQVSFAGTDAQAITDMIHGQTDLVATDRNMLADCVARFSYPDLQLKTLWMSQRPIPPNLVCANPALVKADELGYATNALLNLTLAAGRFDKPRKCFTYIDDADYSKAHFQELLRSNYDSAIPNPTTSGSPLKP